MPFARVQVGAMPQPAQTKQRNVHRHDGGNSAHPKGITMEDLKKQTALRLAQEQQHDQGVQHNTELRDHPIRPLNERQLHGYPIYHQPGTFAEHRPYHNHQINHHPAGLNARHAPQKPYNPQYQPPVHQNPNNTGPSQARQYFENSTVNQRNQPDQHQLGTSSNPNSRSPNNRYLQEQRSKFHRAGSVPNGTQSSQTRVSSNHDPSGSTTAKQTLPHGLTVHELKEMTKARLQAEASDNHETDRKEGAFDNRRGVSPLDFDSSIEARERPKSRNSACRMNHVNLHHGNASDSMTSIPSMVQVNQQNRDKNSLRQSHPSPLPPGFQNFGPTNAAVPPTDAATNLVAPVAAWDMRRQQQQQQQRQQMKLDTWETASVHSHNSAVFSENLGSESAFSGAFGNGLPQQGEGETGGIPFNRSQPYPLAQGLGDSSHGGRSTPSSASASPRNNIYYGNAGPVIPNRRRACTLSPKPGLIHEDRPHFGEDLRVPNFSSSSRSNLVARSRNSYSPVFGQLGLEGSLGSQAPGMVAFGGTANRPRTSSATSLPLGDSFNRPRTSSATSLPPISRTADEFAMDASPNPFSRFPTSQPRSRNDSLPDDLSSAFSEGVLGYSMGSSGFEGNSNGTTDSFVFRDGPTADRRVPAPPGFSSEKGSSAGQYTAFSRVGSVDGVVESHLTNNWEDNVSLPSQVGQSLFSSYSVEEILSNDMGSILKLSGVADRPDRERSNTYPNTSKTDTGAYLSGDFA